MRRILGRPGLSPSEFQRRRFLLGDRQDPDQARDLQRLLDVLLRPQEDDAVSGSMQGSGRVQQHAHAARREERHLAQIDDGRPPPFRRVCGEVRLDLARTLQIEPPPERDTRHFVFRLRENSQLHDPDPHLVGTNPPAEVYLRHCRRESPSDSQCRPPATTMSEYVTQLNERYFAGRLSPAFLEKLADLPPDRADVRAIVERLFRMMRRGGFDASDLAPSQGAFLGSMVAKVLPGAWGGRIPPITFADRHCVIDRYVATNRWRPVGESGTFLDLGCGFPPLTTVETADHFPGWRVWGVDPLIPAYLLYDDRGNYAIFDDRKRAQYFQPTVPSAANWNALLDDSEATRSRFEALLEVLLAGERAGEPPSLAPIEKDGARLLVDPVRHYGRSNLSFAVGGIGSVPLDGVDVVRCFNVLGYFDDSFRERALQELEGILSDGGLLVCGSNVGRSAASRYFVYQKVDGRLLDREFVFGIDNLCPYTINPWYAQHEDDREVCLLMDLIRALRSEPPFVAELVARNDALRAEYGISPRQADGTYGDSDPTLLPFEVSDRAALIGERLDEEGFTERAAGILTSAGHRARRNEVGHVAVEVDGARS